MSSPVSIAISCFVQIEKAKQIRINIFNFCIHFMSKFNVCITPNYKYKQFVLNTSSRQLISGFSGFVFGVIVLMAFIYFLL